MSAPVEPDRVAGSPHPRETSVLFGQDAAEREAATAATEGRMPHAWMITGPQGIGKATLAWRIARRLIAGEGGDSLDMAPDHSVFRQLVALSSPRLFLCRRPWDSKTERLRTAITVEEVRSLKAHFQLSAADGGPRVAIVDSADEMNGSAANALLKILEEPPPDAVLLLVAHRPAALLPTIRSRCRILRCRPLGADDITAALLAAGAESDPTEAGALAALAGGSVGAAIGLLADDGLGRYREIVALLGDGGRLDRRRLLALADDVSGRNAAARYAMTLDLIRLALTRLALSGAGAPIEATSEAEAALHARYGVTPAQGRLWAGLVSDLVGRAAHARSVNLDPAQVILDTLLHIDAAAAEARAHAA